MRGFARRFLLALMLVPLTTCGDLPQPFRGRPGGLAAELAQPPGYRVAVPRPGIPALLDSMAGERMAEALAEALRANEVQAAAVDPLPLDWRLTLEAIQDGRSITPRYRLTDANGTELGSIAGARVPVAAWSAASAETLTAAARQAAPRLADLLLRAEAARRGSTPEALAGNAPRVYLASVRGAPGDGNTALADRIRGALNQRGMLVQDNAVAAGFSVAAEVQMSAGRSPGEQVVELVWTILRRDGEDLGRVVQINAVPARSLDRAWGDAAYAAAAEAAGGIRDVIRNAGGFPTPPEGAARSEGGLTIPPSSTPPVPAPPARP